jgi:hypothetical protein
MIAHIGFFGDADHTFTLTDPMIVELERLTGQGIGTIYQRAVALAFSASDLVEVIRLGLIGGGMAPQNAMQLTDTYARNRPLAETYPLALDILDARWNGTTAPATGDTPE